MAQFYDFYRGLIWRALNESGPWERLVAIVAAIATLIALFLPEIGPLIRDTKLSRAWALIPLGIFTIMLLKANYTAFSSTERERDKLAKPFVGRTADRRGVLRFGEAIGILSERATTNYLSIQDFHDLDKVKVVVSEERGEYCAHDLANIVNGRERSRHDRNVDC